MTDAGNAMTGCLRGMPRWMLVALLRLAGAQLCRRLGCRRGVALPRAAALRRRRHAQPARLCQHASGRAPKQLWELTGEERSHIRPFRREVRAAREETIKALIAEPFDRDGSWPPRRARPR